MKIKNDHQLVQKVLDGSIGHEDFQVFQKRLRQEPELVELYRQYALLHHVLCEEFEEQRLIRKPVAPAPRRWPVAVAGLAAAAVVTLVAAVSLRPSARRAAGPEFFATAMFSPDAVWQIDGGAPAAGLTARLAPGAVIGLHQGQARVTLNSGAAAVIDGDTELAFVADGLFRLGHGRGRFRLDTPGGKLTVATTTFTAVDLGTEFGMVSLPGKPAEVHVFEGRVELRLPDSAERPVLAAGDAARVTENHAFQRIPVAMARFPQDPPRFVQVLVERFDDGAPSSADLDHHTPRQGQGTWRVARGKPVIGGGRLEGADFEGFFKLPAKTPAKATPILLATMEITGPLRGKFHTGGWSGLSFYQDGRELVFFGDSFGPEQTWSLDVKQGLPVVLPKSPLSGPRTVTLCYNRNTGAASLHEGSLPLGPAFCSAMLPAGLGFDEIRIGASPEAALALRSLTVLAGESSD